MSYLSFPRKHQTALRGLAVAAAALALAVGAAHADDPVGKSIYLQLGQASHGSADTTDFTGVGITWAMMSERSFWGAKVYGYWDAYISQWRAPAAFAGGETSYTQIGLVPTWRFRFDEGRSKWFADAGIGITYMDDVYMTPAKIFSTRFQFTERLALGRSFGDTDSHELSLGLQHFSNAGIEKPNPGENFLQLRYAYKF